MSLIDVACSLPPASPPIFPPVPAAIAAASGSPPSPAGLPLFTEKQERKKYCALRICVFT